MVLTNWLKSTVQRLRHPRFTRSLNRKSIHRHDACSDVRLVMPAGSERLEDRTLLASAFGYAFGPDTTDEYIEAVEGAEATGNGEESPSPFVLTSRWTDTATDPAGLGQGDPVTLTWSIVDDGTPIPALSIATIPTESADNSNLIAFLGGIYGVTTDNTDYTDEPWFPHFQSFFDRWTELTGVTYIYEPADDGAAFSAFSTDAPGVLGTRGDIRIGGHAIDGNSNVLAYNFFPNNGEMVIDTNDNFYNDTSQNSRGLRNVLAHEAGHGLGIRHAESDDSDFLMEPNINTAFDGPQYDDILAAQRHYGDANTNNDTSANAVSLGTLTFGQTASVGTDADDMIVEFTDTDFVSIDDNDEIDFYSFTVTESADVRLTLSPVGPTYLNGPQDLPQAAFNSQEQSDLTLELRDTNGTTVLVTANATGLGGSEVINHTLPGSGTYFARVTGADDAAQMYQLDVLAKPAGGVVPFHRDAPLGGLMFTSVNNFGNLANAADQEDFAVFLEGGQTITAFAETDDNVVLSVEVVGVSGTVTAAGAGDDVVLPPTAIPTDGTYTVRVTADGGADVNLELFRNAAVEDQVGDTSDGSELDITNSLIQLGSDRLAVAGISQATPTTTLEFVQSNDPTAFVDITTGGGAAGNLPDGAIFNLNTSVGNAIFPAGNYSLDDDGAIIVGHNNFLTGVNTALPNATVGNALFPFWDDLDDATVYIDERVVNGIDTLIVQWEDRPHVDNIGAATFQLQLFDTGPVFARFVYQDVDFGNAAFDNGASATIGYQENSTTGLQFSFNAASISDGDVLDLQFVQEDIDEYEIDLTGKAGKLIDIVLAGQDGSDFSGETLELLDVNGTTVLATGVTDPVSGGTDSTNFDLGILDFTVPADGVYTIRVTAGFTDADYGIVVTHPYSFDTEPNNSDTDPLRDLTSSSKALGHADSATDQDDYYQFDLTADDVVLINTQTLFDAASTTPANTLDPELEIVHPNGTTVVATDTDSAADGKNASVFFTAPATGTYTMRVRATAGAGEYLVTILSDLDFGDAPTSVQAGGGTFVSDYPVTIAENGARHIATGATLGAERDSETDGMHSADADNDDTTGTPDDEDGVTFAAAIFLASTVSPSPGDLTIDLQNPHPTSNRLDAWIDWNQDGDWDDPGEQIFQNFDLGTVAGPQDLVFEIPRDTGTNVLEGTTYARFRLSSAGSLSPTGAAADGEVEDYEVEVANTLPVVFTELMFDPFSDESHWEWLEIFNGGSTPIDLAGFVLDDNANALLTGANIAAGSIAPDSYAVLYDASNNVNDFTLGWRRPGINLIPVTNWPGLNNTGDDIGLWPSFAAYGSRDFTMTIDELAYEDDNNGWPNRLISGNVASYYLTDTSLNNNNGANWSLSADGTDGAYTSANAGGNSGNDIGSPGFGHGPAANDFVRLDPLASLIFLSQNSGSIGAGQTIEYSVFVEGGQTLVADFSAPVAANLSIDLVGISGVVNGAVNDSSLVLPLQQVANDGTYTLRITSDTATTYDLGILLNAVLEIPDSSDGSELAIDNTFLGVPTAGRWAAVGVSDATTGGVLEFTQTNDASQFVDISGTGTSLNLLDGGFANITSTFGNAAFPAGPLTISEDGTLAAGSGVRPDNMAANPELPDNTFTTALIPWWDDLVDGNTPNAFWEERQVGGIDTLIVQWQGVEHNLGGANGITFQVQVFDTGPVAARFVYTDVNLGSGALNGGASATIGYQENATTAVQFSHNTASVAANDVLTLAESITPDVDEYTVDLTGKIGNKIDVFLTGIEGTAFEGQTLELLNPSGTLVATGTATPLAGPTNATNGDLAILDYMVPADGIYTVRVTASFTDVAYSVVVADSVTADVEPNTDRVNDPLRSMTDTRDAIGYLDAATDANDHFTVDLTDGDLVTFSTLFPLDLPVSPTHNLDPEIEVFLPNGTSLATDLNSAADGVNAVLSFTASETGTYTIRVGATSGLGEYLLSLSTIATNVLINEVDADTSGADTLEFVELYDGGAGNTSLDGLVLVLFNGSDDASYEAFDLDGFSTSVDGFFVVGNSSVASVGLVIPNDSIQNGADAVALFVGDGTDFANDTPVTTTNLLDALVYDTDDADDAGLLVLLTAGGQFNEDENNNKDNQSSSRVPDGGTARDTSTYVAQTPTPGAANAVDNTAPTFNSIERLNPATSPTNADTLVFRATFSEDVQNVNDADFDVTGTTATVTNVAVVNASTYDVTVSGGDLAGLDGTVGLDLAAGQNIEDLAGNALPGTEPTTDETYLVDNTAPAFNSIERQNPATSPTNADTLVFRATFSEDVQNVNDADFDVSGTTATVTNVAVVNASTYDVTVSGGDLAGLNGTVGLDLAAGQNIEDVAGNALPGTEPTTDETYVVDNTAPAFNSIEQQNPATSPTNADTLVFRATFSEDVQNVNDADFDVTGTTATVTNVAVVNASTYDVTVSGGDLAGLDGTVGLDLAAGQNIEDLAGNALPGTEPTTDETYVVDNTDPTFNSIERQNPATSPTNADTLVFRATFSEDVQNVNDADFDVSGTTATVTNVAVVNASTYDVTVSGGDLAGLNGTVGLDLAAGQNIEDLAGNALPGTEPTTDETYVVDNTAPAFNSTERQNPATSPTNADTLVFRATFSEDVQNVNDADFDVSGTTATVTNVAVVNASTYDVTVSGGDLAGLNGTVGLDLAAGQNIEDVAGNALPGTEPTTDETYVVDNTAPAFNSIERQNPATSPTNADTLVFRATFSEDVQNVNDADFDVSGTTATVTNVAVVNASTYDVTVSGGDLAGLNGTVGLDLAAGQDIEDLAGNALPGTEPTTDETYVVDNTAPTFNSIERQNPATSPTNADTLVFRATFSEDVQSVNDADFDVSGTTAAVTNVAVVNASTYDVTVSGGDLAGLNGTVGLDLAAGQNIEDLAGNALPGTEPAADETYVVDNTAPAFNSIERQNPATSPTNADTLVFRATFSEDVQNVNDADFDVTGTTASVTNVSVVNASTYDVTVSGGDLAGLNGTVGLDLAAGQNIEDLAGNALPGTEPTTDETYVVDNTAPAFNSIERQNPATSPTNADSLVFRATFSEDVQNVNDADFDVSGTTATVTNVAVVNASTYDVTVSGGDLAGLNGTVGLDLAAGQNIEDLAGNALPGTEPATDETYLVQNDAPTLNSFTRQNPATSPTNADTLVFRATFSEDVQNVNDADFDVSGTTATVTNVAVVNASTYDVTVSGGDLAGLNGTVGLDLAAGQNIEDLAGNALPGTEPTTDETYLVDNTAPAFNSIERQNPATSPTNADTLVFRATFSEDVQNVNDADFDVTGTTATVTNVAVVNASTYDVTVSGGDLAGLNGTVGLDLAAGQNIEDLAGNALPGTEPTTDETYLVQNDAPTLNSFTRQNPATSPTNADTLVFRATFSEDVQNVNDADFDVSGTTATVTNVAVVSASTYDVTVSGGDLAGLDGTVGLDLAAGQNIEDLAGNALPGTEPTTDETYVVDNTDPTFNSIERQNPATSPTNADTLVFRATFSEDVQNVNDADFDVSGTTATVTNVAVVNASTYDVTVSGGDLAGLNGTVGLDLAAGQNIEDLAGNALPGTEPTTDETYVVDNTAPAFNSTERQNPATSPTNADTLVFRATFSEDVQNVNDADFDVSGTTATVTNVAVVNASTYDVTVSGGDLAGLNGTVGLNLAAGQNIEDVAGNALPGTEPTTDETYAVDNTAPAFNSTERQNPATSPTNADTLVFRATFSEDVQNVNDADFDVSGTTATVTNVAVVNASTFDVTVSGGDLAGLNGTVGLDLAAGQNIEDLAGNALPGTEPATDETFVVDNTAPTFNSIERQNPATSPTNADTLVFRATFSEDVQNVNDADFDVTGTTATVTNVAVVNASTYDVTVSGGDLAGLDGTVGLDLAAGQNIEDLADNALPGTEPATDETYVVDNTAPAFNSIERQNPATSPTNADTMVFRATFSEDVQNVNDADFDVTGTTATVTNVAVVSASTYDVTVSGGDLAGLDGTVGLDLAAGQNIEDLAGNALPGTEPTTDETYVVDNTAPAFNSIERQNPATSPTNADTLVFRATFGEDVQNVNDADFDVSGTTATVTNVAVVNASTYDVTVSGGDLAGLNGTVGLDLAAGQNIEDLAGNALPGTEPTTDETYVVDNTAPAFNSIERQNPATSPTNADTLVFRATFSEDVQNVNDADFDVSGTTATVTNVAVVSASTYDVTVSGGDLAGLDGTVGLDLAAGQNIEDLAGNALPGTEPTTDETYVVDNTAPAFNSIERQNPATSPTNADTLVFRATFSEDVQNVNDADFDVSGTTATVTNVAVVSASTYDVTVSGGDLAGLDGTVGLDLAAGQNIEDLAGNALPGTEPTTDETYVVDNTDPAFNSIERQNPATSPTNADTLVFRATFSEDVQNVNDADFDVSGTTATVTNVAVVNASTYDVTVSGGDLAGLNGTVGLDLAAGQNIEDLAGNALPGTEPATDETYLVQNDAPTLNSFTRQVPATSPTNADTLVFRATFSEDVQNVNDADFDVSGTTATVTNVAVVNASTYDVTVSGGDLAGLNGTVGLDLAAGQNIEDLAGNALPGTEPTTDETYVVDNTAPTFNSIERQSPATSPTNADTLVFRATFSVDVQNVNAADFDVSGTTAAVTNVAVVNASTYDVTVSGGDLAGLNGTVGLDLAAGQNIEDLAGNALPGTEPTTDETYVVDNTAPAFNSIERQNPATSPTNADTLVFRATFSEDVQNVNDADFDVTGTTASVTNVAVVNASTYDVTVSGGDLAGLDGTVGLDLAAGQNIEDLAGNALPGTEPATDETYVVDNTAPTFNSIERQNPATSPTNADTLVFRATFSEDVQSVNDADFDVTGTTATVTNVAVVNASTYDVTVSGGDLAGLNGTVGLDLAAGQNIEDLAGNALPGTEPTTDETYVVDNTAPAFNSIERQNPATSPTNADTLVFRATFSEDVQNVNDADFDVTGTTATVTNVAVVSASTYDVTVSGGDLAGLDGTVGLDLAAGQNIEDLAGNALPGTEPATDETYVVDNTAPTFNSIERQNPATSPTNADTLVFRATFSEDVQSVNDADFDVTGTTATVTNVAVVNASTYDVTVSGGDLAGLNGTVGLDLAAGQNIEDLAGNALPGTEPATDETYVVDNTAPAFNSIERQNPATSPTNADTLVFRATFSEDVQNVNDTDFDVTGTTATVTNVAVVNASTYDVTVSGGDLAGLNGTVGLDLAAGQNIEDLAGNALPGTEPTTDETYLVQNDAPTLNSFTRQNPATSPTNADTLVFRAMFSEDVQNVNDADFDVTGTTATVTNVAVVNASTYDVTVSGGDLAGLNGTVGLDLAAGQNIEDLAGNALPGTEPTTDETYVVDNTDPTFNSIERQNPATSPTNADTLVFRATFSEDVQNVNDADFDVSGTTATVTNVAVVNASTYDVTVSGGDLAGLNGTVGLDLAAGQNIEDVAGNALPGTEPTTDETYVVDNTAPAFNSIERQNPATSPTNADTLVFRATFSEDVQNVNDADFDVSGTTATVTNVAVVNASTYDVTVSGGDLAGLNGTVGLDLAAGQNIEDVAGNALPGTEPATDETYVVDNTAPAFNSIERQNPATSPTNADTLVFRATFSEDVQNVNDADFDVTGTTASVTNVAVVNASTYDVTVSGGDLAGLDGTVGLDLAAGQNIEDLAGNALPGTEPATDETYVVDNTAPTFNSIERQNPATSPTNADTLVFRATFSEDVQSVNDADFDVTGTTASVTNVAVVNASTYDVTVSGGDLAGLNGTVGLDLAAGQNIEDLAGNALPGTEPAADETYLVDNTAPGIQTLNPADDATGAAEGANLIATFDENVQKGDGNIVVRRSSDNFDFATIDVNSARVTVSGSQVTIDPPTNLESLTAYHVIIPAGTFEDLAGNAFAGISDATTWNFATGDGGGAPVPMQFDFGTDSSALEAGFSRVTPATGYDALQGFGWTGVNSNSAIEARDRNSPDDLQRDYNLIRTGSMIFGVDVANGIYNVTVTVGSAANSRDRVEVGVEDAPVGQFSAPQGAFDIRTFFGVLVTDGQLTVEIARGGGTAAAINALTVEAGSLAPAVDTTDSALIYTGGDPATLIDPGLIVVDPDDANLTGATVTIAGGHDASEDVLAFTNQLGITGSFDAAAGVLTLDGIAPVEDYQTALRSVTYFNSNSDADAIDRTIDFRLFDGSGFGLGSRTIVIVKLPASNARSFDFGTTTSPIHAGFVGVNNTTAYSIPLGYGWLNTSTIEARDRSFGPQDERRDYNLVRTGSATFATNIADGDYDVTVTIGSAANNRDRVGLFLEGTQVDTISTIVGDIFKFTYRVTVTGNRLEFGIERQGSTAASVNALEIVPVPAPIQTIFAPEDELFDSLLDL